MPGDRGEDAEEEAEEEDDPQLAGVHVHTASTTQTRLEAFLFEPSQAGGGGLLPS